MMANGVWQVQSSRAMNFEPRKSILEAKIVPFTKICTPENHPLYSITHAHIVTITYFWLKIVSNIIIVPLETPQRFNWRQSDPETRQ